MTRSSLTPHAQDNGGFHVTHHAVMRFQERVANVSEADAIVALHSDTIRMAAEIGAPYVRLPGRQRVVLRGQAVVTVLPADENVRCLDRRIVRG